MITSFGGEVWNPDQLIPRKANSYYHEVHSILLLLGSPPLQGLRLEVNRHPPDRQVVELEHLSIRQQTQEYQQEHQNP